MSETSLIFTGDIGFDKYMDRKWEDKELLSDEVADFLHSGDHLIVNVEGPIIAKSDINVEEAGKKNRLWHNIEPAALPFFKELGADVWNICNNHIMDAGADGIRHSLQYAAMNSVRTLGAGMNLKEAAAPVCFDEAGGIGMIGVGYQRACRAASEELPGCFSWSELELIKTQIENIKKSCRWCIVVAHAGEEFTSLPSPYTRERYMKYLEFGADIVVAHHPHVPMNYERVGDKLIFYSLGNFIFDTDYQRSQLNTEYGLFVKLNFTENSFDFEPFGIKIDRTSEHILKWELPAIFADVREEEYQKLYPLAIKAFIENTKKQVRYLNPGQYDNASEEDWLENFYQPLRSGRVPGETLDFQILYPLSKLEEEKAWKTSSLKAVVDYILAQL